jgi:hypothetical protein
LKSWRCIFIRWKAGDASGFEFWGYIFILLSFESWRCIFIRWKAGDASSYAGKLEMLQASSSGGYLHIPQL